MTACATPTSRTPSARTLRLTTIDSPPARLRARFDSSLVRRATRMDTVGSFLGALCIALCTLCGGCRLSMKPPAQGVDPKVVEVHDYRPPQNTRPDALRIGAAQVSDVSGTAIHPPGLTAYGRARDQDRWEYTFTLKDGPHQLRGECSENVGKVRWYGIGEVMLNLRCSCFEGATRVTSLSVKEGSGEAQLPGGERYTVTLSRDSKEGRYSRGVLGYLVRGASGEGGVDVTRDARAYYPHELPEEQRLPLTCAYAALLLHRPTK